MTVVAAYLHIQ